MPTEDTRPSGPSAAGKSTVLVLMLALLAFYAGALIFRDNALPHPLVGVRTIERVVLLESDKPVDAERSIESILDETTEVNFIRIPLTEALEFLAKKHGIKIVLDNPALQEGGIFPIVEKVNLRASGIMLRSVLRLMLRQFYLTYFISDRQLVVTTDVKAEERFITVVYPVGDLIHSPADAKEFTELLQYLCETASWTTEFPDNSERDDLGTMEYSTESNSLKIIHNQFVHETIEEVLYAFRHPLKPGESIGDFAKTPMEKKIRDELNRVVTLNFEEITLGNVLLQIVDEYGIPMVADTEAFVENEYLLSELVSIKFSNITLGNALRGILRPYDLDYAVVDEVLVISSSSFISDIMKRCTYRVDDLIDREMIAKYWPVQRSPLFGRQNDNPIGELITLIHMIPEAGFIWEGSNSRMVNFYPAQRLLFMNNSPGIHDKLSRLLDNLRKPLIPGESLDLLAPDIEQAQREKILIEELNQRVDLDPDDTPLLSAIQVPSRLYDLPPSFADRKNYIDSLTVSEIFRNVRRVTALNTILRRKQLGYTIEDDLIAIDDDSITCRFYADADIDLQDPLNGWSINGSTSPDAQIPLSNLLDVIQLQQDGEEFLIHFEINRSLCLSNSRKNHVIFGEMLECIRHRRSRNASPERMALLKLLDKPVTLPPCETTLNMGHLLAHLTDQVRIDTDIAPETWDRKYVDFRMREPTLSKILKQFNVPASLQGSILYADERPDTDWDVYPISSSMMPIKGEMELFYVLESLTQSISKEEFYSFEGCAYFNGCLIIRDTPEVHRQVAAWFAKQR